MVELLLLIFWKYLIKEISYSVSFSITGWGITRKVKVGKISYEGSLVFIDFVVKFCGRLF